MSVERSPVEWALLPMQRYADFRGRAPRAEYWWFYLATIVVGIVASVIDAAIGASESGWVSAIVNLLVLIPSIAVMVRRLHDTDRSGWWLLIGILPFVGVGFFGVTAALEGAPEFSSGMIVSLAIAVIAVIALFVFMVLPGTQGANDYGPDPYGPGDELQEIFA